MPDSTSPAAPGAVLITGGAGFIGSQLAQRYADSRPVVLFDLDFDAAKPIGYTDVLDHEQVSVVTGDVRDADAFTTAMKGVSVVIHAAAIVGVHNVRMSARKTIETNLLGTVNLLHACVDSPDLERLVYFSTSEVFGGSSFRVAESRNTSIGSVDEARWSYSIAKLAGEHLVAAYHRELDMPAVTVRPFNVFGPRRTGDHAMLRFIDAALRDDPLVVHGDGTQLRAWCYIDDFIDGVVAAATEPEAIGNHFNLGNSRNTLTIYELAKRVIAITGSRSSIVFDDVDHPDIDIRVPSTKKAEEVLGFSPSVEIDEGIRRTAEWYEANPSARDVLRHSGSSTP